MSGRTAAVRRALAQAGDRGLAHLARNQDTGTWISNCGRQIRGKDIRAWDGEAAGIRAIDLGNGFCQECRDDAIVAAGNVVDGVLVLLRAGVAGNGTTQLLDVPLTAIASKAEQRAAGDDLIASVAADGVVEPIIARRTAAGLVLVAGTRRLAAAFAAGLDSIPTIVRNLDDEHALLEQLLGNLHRQDLDPIAQARAYQDAVERLELSKDALADRLGLSRSQVSNTIRLLGLPEHLQERVAAGVLSAAHGRALLRITDPDEQDALADRIYSEGLTTKDADAAARRIVPVTNQQLDAVSEQLAVLLAVKVRVSATASGARITLDVSDADLERMLLRLGASDLAA